MAEPLELKKTLNLPKTDFPMKAGLPLQEPKQLAAWQESRLYERILEARQGQPSFVLHDGPPYPTGTIHQGPVVGQSPRGGRPNHRVNITHALGLHLAAAGHAELHPNRRTGVILVLDLGLSQRCRIVNAPINRFAAAMRKSFLHEIKQSARDNGLIIVAHGQIRIIPAAQNSQSLEVPLMLLDVTGRKLPA